MTIHGPILSSTAVGYICAAVVACVVLWPSQKTVDPTETAAIAATCQAKGLVARHEVGPGSIRTFCQRPEDAR